MPLFSAEDITRIPNPDPNWHYTWVYTEPQCMSDYIQAGWQLVKEDEAKSLFGSGVVNYVTTSDGRIRRGDLTLMKIEIEKAREIEAMRLREAREQKAMTDERFMAGVQEIGHPGIKPFVMSGEEYADREKFDRRESQNRVGYTGGEKTDLGTPGSEDKTASSTKKK